MRPEGGHLLKQALIFAVAATLAVTLGVWLHGAGRPGRLAASFQGERDAVAPPVLRDAPLIPATAGRALAPASRVTDTDLTGPPVIRRAIPISEAAVAALAVAAGNLPTPGTVTDGGLAAALSSASPVPYVYQAVLMNDVDWLGKLLKAGFPPDAVSPAGDTALCAAVNAGNVPAVDLLLAHKADPDKPGKDGQPPVALGSLRRAEKILAALLKAGANANAVFVKPVPEPLLASVTNRELRNSLRTDTGVTALMAVAALGYTEGVLELLQHGARANLPTKKFYRYPINFAAEQRYVFLMRLLLGRPADAEPDILVTVDLSQQKAYLQQFGQVIDQTSISTGREGYDTPAGRYVVTDKHQNWTSTIYKVSMPWFMRLNCSDIGLHAGYVTGAPASHGCIRLPLTKARKWFDLVKVGDEVQIVH